jgi:putative peptidoglycan lipid II flippase
MKKTSRLTRISLLLFVFFGLDKLLAVVRTIIIGRQFGLSAELDVFNAANNLPDLLFALISGGALAIAFIPILSETLAKKGRDSSWKLFSQIANLAFIMTAVMALIIAVFAEPLVAWELGIAPGFTPDQQGLAVQLMRLNLVATLIFSISGLVMAGLQANQHFLLPAMAPLVYDGGKIFGAVILAPDVGYRIAGIQLPGLGLGIHGLVYGVIIGAALHLLIQVPGLFKFKFKWFASLSVRDEGVRKVLRLMGPRLVSMVFIQLIFLAQDNLASRLEVGSVTALSFGWWIQQVPQTMIGTAIATALLPTLSDHLAAGENLAFKNTIERSLKVMIALSLPIAVILSLTSLPLIQTAFGFSLDDSQMILWAAQAFLIGLLGHNVVELGVRSFYAKQNARIPMAVSATGFFIFLGLSIPFMSWLSFAGIALANALSYSIQAVVLVFLLNRHLPDKFRLGGTLLRAVLSSVFAGLGAWLVLVVLPIPLPALYLAIGGMGVGTFAAVFPIWQEIRLLVQL